MKAKLIRFENNRLALEFPIDESHKHRWESVVIEYDGKFEDTGDNAFIIALRGVVNYNEGDPQPNTRVYVNPDEFFQTYCYATDAHFMKADSKLYDKWHHAEIATYHNVTATTPLTEDEVKRVEELRDAAEEDFREKNMLLEGTPSSDTGYDRKVHSIRMCPTYLRAHIKKAMKVTEQRYALLTELFECPITLRTLSFRDLLK
jgi:hypothetical protein